MTQPPNPVTQAFRAVRRDPAVFLIEILWRWSFALIAFFLLFIAGLILLGPLNIGPTLASAWRSPDSSKIGILLLTIVLRLGNKLLVAAIVLPIIIALIWALLAASARRVTVRRLSGDNPLRFRTMLVLQTLRAFVTWMAVLLLLAAIVGAFYLATRGPRPDLVRLYTVASPLVVLIGACWLALNWYFSVAAIFGREGQSFRGAFRQARQTVRQQRSDFAGTGFVFLLLRFLLLLIVLAICGLTSRMAGTAPQALFVLTLVIVLAYFAISDFLYVSRMAAYLALADAHAERDVAELLEESSRPHAGQSSSL
jgi:hypothetical protein